MIQQVQQVVADKNRSTTWSVLFVFLLVQVFGRDAKELNKRRSQPSPLARIIANDVAMAASLMKLANSSFFGLRLKAQSVDHVWSICWECDKPRW